jgi:sugar lactone lactonase YvrE
MGGVVVEPVGDRVSEWGEGPLWWGGVLWYVDIEGHAVCSLDPASGTQREWPIGHRVGCIVPRRTGGFLIAGDYGIAFFDPVTGQVEPVPGADPEASKRPDNRFNDGKCDPQGRFWTGTISLPKRRGDAALYVLDAGRKLARAVGGITNSNGIAWNAAASEMYYIDTPTKRIDRFAFDSATGHLTSRETVFDTDAAGLAGSPDGMTIDIDGNLWVALCHAGAVICLDPAVGRLLRRLEFPASETTSCTFGGGDLSDLFVTTGIRAEKDEPLGGRLFRARGLGVAGLPACAYAG